MTDSLFFIPFLIWLTLTTAVGKKTRIVVTQKCEKHTREFTKDERQTISQLAEDMNLLLHQSIAVWASLIIAIFADFFALVTIVLSPINEIWAFIFSLFFMSVSYLFFYIFTKRSDIVIEAHKLYIENKKNNRYPQLHRDAELLRSIREKSQLTEEQAFELGEEAKHNIWNKLKGKFFEHE